MIEHWKGNDRKGNDRMIGKGVERKILRKCIDIGRRMIRKRWK